MNIGKIFDGVTNFFGLENTDQKQADTQTQTFVPQSAVDGWLANLYSQTENNKTVPFAFKGQQQTQQEPEPTAAESAYFLRLYSAQEKGAAKEAKPRLPESLLLEADPKAATEKHLRRTVERYYYFYKDITDQAGIPTKENPTPKRKTEQEITGLKTERDAL